MKLILIFFSAFTLSTSVFAQGDKDKPVLFKGIGSEDDLKPGFVVRDGKYLSARWPGDAYRFANDFVEMVEGN